jgi:uncharacterized iron-regulated protein
MRFALAVCLALVSAGCAMPQGAPRTAAPQSVSRALADLTDFTLVRTDGGARAPTAVTIEEAAEVLAAYDVIFLGEVHRHPGNHLAQMALYRAIQERHPRVALSLEQFERDVQTVVDDYVAGRIGEESLRRRGRAWDNYPVSYRPLMEYAKAHGQAVIASEAPTMVVRCVGQEGPPFLARMKPEQRGWAAAQLNLQDGPYKDKFMAFATGDGGHGEATAGRTVSEAALRSFAAQVTRDDTMAESIHLHRQKHPGDKVVHLNGYFHSESFLGTAERLKLRDPSVRIAVVNPVEVEDPRQPTVSAEQARTGTFVLLIQPQPKSYANDEEMKAAITGQMDFRAKNRCEL